MPPFLTVLGGGGGGGGFWGSLLMYKSDFGRRDHSSYCGRSANAFGGLP